MMRTVVIGGYGNFGARICRDLSADADIQVIAAGRNPDAARFSPRVESARLDLESPDFALELKQLAPRLVIHCAGPFQGQDYRVAQAALSAGAHYIDMADGRDFVAGFAAQLDSGAREAGLLMISGASTVPALSSAVIDELRLRLRQIEEIRMAIAPVQRAPRGEATIAAVLSYAGKPFKWLRDGAWCDAWGWQELTRVRFAGLGVRWAAACDIPDLALFPRRYPGVRTVEFRAALELGIQHFAIWAAAGLRRAGLPLAIERAAGPLNRAASLLDWFGSDRGGMLVSVTGTGSDGTRGRVQWHLTADGNHGPEIPCMATTLLAGKLAKGQIAQRGAFPCVGLLQLAEFAPQFARWRISTSIEESPA
jgi:NAD(P)-dependent dehydrogenase (short-subunit alcohol dehydrogenase family)